MGDRHPDGEPDVGAGGRDGARGVDAKTAAAAPVTSALPGTPGTEGNPGSLGVGRGRGSGFPARPLGRCPPRSRGAGWRVPGTTPRAVRPSLERVAAAGGDAPEGSEPFPSPRSQVPSALREPRGPGKAVVQRLVRPEAARGRPRGGPGEGGRGTAEEGRTSEDAHAPLGSPTPAPPSPPGPREAQDGEGLPCLPLRVGAERPGPVSPLLLPASPSPPHPDSHPAFCAGRAERAGARGAVAAGEGVGLHVAAAAWPLRAKRLDRTRAFGLGV